MNDEWLEDTFYSLGSADISYADESRDINL